MYAARKLPRPSRLHALLLAAVCLSVTAGVINYRYWTRRPPHTHAAAATPVDPAASRAAEDLRKEREALERLLTDRPDDSGARLRLAELHLRAGDADRSLVELERLQEARPRDPDLFLRRSLALKTAGRLPEAEAAARQALALRPDDVKGREWLAEVCLQQGKAREARALFEACLKETPESYHSLLGKGRALEELFRHHHPISIAEMVTPVEKAVVLDGENPLGLLVLARMKFAYEKRPEEAEKLALRAADRDGRSAGPYILLTEIALSLPPTPDNIQRAGEYAYQGGLRNVRDPRPAYQIGRVFLLQNDTERAIRALERSLSLGPTPEAVSQLAMAYRRAGNVERAEHFAGLYQQYQDLLERRDALLRARMREPDRPDHYFALAEVYLEAGEPDAAEKWVEAGGRVAKADPRRETLAARVRQAREKKDAPLLRMP